MPRFIVKLEQRYFMWSTVVDAPVTEPMSLEEFRGWYALMYPGTANLDERLDRVEDRGISAFPDLYPDAESLLCCNRAGLNQSDVPLDDLRAWARGELTLASAASLEKAALDQIASIVGDMSE